MFTLGNIHIDVFTPRNVHDVMITYVNKTYENIDHFHAFHDDMAYHAILTSYICYEMIIESSI